MQTANIDKVTAALKAEGITNPYSIAGILSIISKESGFIPQSEVPYNNTSNARIKAIFPKTANLTDLQLDNLKKSPVGFFDYVYGGRYGNAANEGYKYRGRGFNQLTFKDNYSTYGKLLGLDLVNNPDLVNKPDIAAKVVAAYMKRQFTQNAATVKQRYGASNINDFSNAGTAVNAFFNANAGFGKDTSKQISEGKTAALAKVAALYDFLINSKTATGLPLLLILGIAAYKIFK